MARIVDETFEALFALTDIRQLLRESKPAYKLDEKQKDTLEKKLDRARRALDAIEEEFNRYNAADMPKP